MNHAIYRILMFISERIYDDESFPERHLAALVASKVMNESIPVQYAARSVISII